MLHRNCTNRLASVTDASGTRTVSYDERGNTVAETRPGGVSVAASYDVHARLESYDRTNIGTQTYSFSGLGDRVRRAGCLRRMVFRPARCRSSSTRHCRQQRPISPANLEDGQC